MLQLKIKATELTGLAYRELLDVQRNAEKAAGGVRELVKAHFEARGGKRFWQEAPGMDLEFYVIGRTIAECRHRVKESADGISHCTASAAIARLWENSKPANPAQERDYHKAYKESSIEWVHKRIAKMQLGKDVYEVKITGIEKKDKNVLPFLYVVKTRKIEK